MDDRIIEILKELVGFDEKLEFLFEKIKQQHSELQDAEKKGSEHVVALGNSMILLERVVKKHGKGKWADVLKERYPDIKKRTAERYMKVARQVDLEKAPALACLGKTALYKLTTMAGKEDLAAYLSFCGYDVKIDPNDKEAIEDMKDALQEYIDFCESLSPSEPRKFRRDKGQKDTEKDNETKAKSKPKNTNIINKLNRSATSFIKNVDMVLNETKTFRINQDQLAEIIKEVEEKLADLEEFKKTLKSKKDAKRRKSFISKEKCSKEKVILGEKEVGENI
jgi:hypothetical protein